MEGKLQAHMLSRVHILLLPRWYVTANKMPSLTGKTKQTDDNARKEAAAAKPHYVKVDVLSLHVDALTLLFRLSAALQWNVEQDTQRSSNDPWNCLWGSGTELFCCRDRRLITSYRLHAKEMSIWTMLLHLLWMTSTLEASLRLSLIANTTANGLLSRSIVAMRGKMVYCDTTQLT